MDIVRQTFQQLRRDYALGEYEYSRVWLRKSRGYFAYLKCTNSEPSLDAILSLYGEAMRRTGFYEDLATQHRGTGTAAYERQADYYREIRENLESEIKHIALSG